MRILIVDDHQIIIDGLKGLMEGEDNFDQLLEAHNGEETFQVLDDETVDLILLDIDLPDMSGFEICKQIKSHDPAPKIIALTMHGNAGYINKMINAGVDGYLLKNTGRDELILAIQTVMKDERYFSKEVTNALLSGTMQKKKPRISDFIQKLTRREQEILQLITEELTTDEIAAKLFISSTTVISHRKNLLRKLNAKNVAGLVKKAYEFGLLNKDKDS